MSRVGKRPVELWDEGLEPEEEEVDPFEELKERFRRFLDGVIADAIEEAKETLMEQARQEVNDQGCFHDKEWTEPVKDEFYKSLDSCFSAFDDAFQVSLSERLNTYQEDAAVWEDLPRPPALPPLYRQLEEHMILLGLTQVQAAAALGVSKMAISQWLKGPNATGGRRISRKRAAQIRAWIRVE